MRHGITRKRSTKMLKHTENVFRKKICRWKVSVNPRCKAIYIIGQRKEFTGQGIPKSSCAWKETVDITHSYNI